MILTPGQISSDTAQWTLGYVRLTLTERVEKAAVNPKAIREPDQRVHLQDHCRGEGHGHYPIL